MASTVAVAGSTGSIGTQTLDVVRRHPEEFRVVALGAGGSSVELLIAQAVEFRPEVVAIHDDTHASKIAAGLPSGCELRVGDGALASLGSAADVCVNGVVGFAGLGVTLATLHAGRRLALANKESLIAGGPVVQRARLTPGAELIPVDSEHGALHQCLRSGGYTNGVHVGNSHDRHAAVAPRRVDKLVLTASGGPFRGRTSAELAHVTVAEALAHPTWSMGPKISVDSSTLMNKGLEVIEAYELFGEPAGDAGVGIDLDDIEVVVHPQSIVHSMVTYDDGSTIAQLSSPDMRLPIGYALAWPDRLDGGFGQIDWSTIGHLDFEPPDTDAFPCLMLAFEAARLGNGAPAWLNAANEVSVAAFLKGHLPWIDIPAVLSEALSRHESQALSTESDVVDLDRCARAVTDEIVATRA